MLMKLVETFTIEHKVLQFNICLSQKISRGSYVIKARGGGCFIKKKVFEGAAQEHFIFNKIWPSEFASSIFKTFPKSHRIYQMKFVCPNEISIVIWQLRWDCALYLNTVLESSPPQWEVENIIIMLIS